MNKPKVGHEVAIIGKVIAVGDVAGGNDFHCDVELPSGIKILNMHSSNIADTHDPKDDELGAKLPPMEVKDPEPSAGRMSALEAANVHTHKVEAEKAEATE